MAVTDSDWLIRRAGLEDVSALIELRLALLREVGNITPPADLDALAEANCRYLRAALPNGRFVAWVAEESGRLIAASGLVMLERPPHERNLSGLEAYIMNLYTIPEWRGRGIGQQLLERLIEHARSMGARRIWLHDTGSGRGLYVRAGFTPALKEMELVW